MKCVICKQGVTYAGQMTLTLAKKDTTIVIKEVPADICENCGESYVLQEITSQLLQQSALSRKSKLI